MLFIFPRLTDIVNRVPSFLDASPRVLNGDFNNYLHHYWDTFNTGSIDPLSQPTALSRLLEEAEGLLAC